MDEDNISFMQLIWLIACISFFLLIAIFLDKTIDKYYIEKEECVTNHYTYYNYSRDISKITKANVDNFCKSKGYSYGWAGCTLDPSKFTCNKLQEDGSQKFDCFDITELLILEEKK